MSLTKRIPEKIFYTDISFKLLMKKRINNVLVISSSYDYFILEEDGRIDEQVFNEYASLGLNYPPQFFHADNLSLALTVIKEKYIDLIIYIKGNYSDESTQLIEYILNKFPKIPTVLLSSLSNESLVNNKSKNIDRKKFSFVFYWHGEADIMLAIVKLIEDRMNVDHDVNEIGVQTIILVENSVRYYSLYLPLIYKNIFRQSKEILDEGLNAHQKMLRMRGRPKILLATNFEEAFELYEKYKHNLLGIISDISFDFHGKHHEEAGILLIKKIRNENPYIPVILQSFDLKHKQSAETLKAGFICKSSPTLSTELIDYFKLYLCFGDFVFRNPKTLDEIDRAHDLHTLQQKILDVNEDSFVFHLKNNHISKWLKARSFFEISQLIEPLQIEDFENINAVRTFLFEAISSFKFSKTSGAIIRFNKNTFSEHNLFTRIGEGSIGGKARGLAFLDFILKRHKLIDSFNEAIITIPRTVVLATDVFDEFMENNHLYSILKNDINDEEILQQFIHAEMPQSVIEDLNFYITVVKSPIVIRSSSLLEDSYSLPLAGAYKTYMIPNTQDHVIMFEMLCRAIKSVYASMFYTSCRNYLAGLTSMGTEEKMAVVLQEVCGSAHDDIFYPTISGIARSINFYPVLPEKTDDGIINVAFGLGKYICDGGLSLRFSPAYPQNIIQLSGTELTLKDTQKTFLALSLNPDKFITSIDEGINISSLPIKSAESDSALNFIASTFDLKNNIIRDGANHEGKKLITFAGILKHKVFPLADIMNQLMQITKQEMSNHVEIEFAVDFQPTEQKRKVVNLLQIRPIITQLESDVLDSTKIKNEHIIVQSSQVIGNGIFENIHDFVFVKTENFNPSFNKEIAENISQLNKKLEAEGKNYILAGPGRWGSSDDWLGIPVKWNQISSAKIIIELSLDNYKIEPSQGTHFFFNMIASGAGYFAVNPAIHEDIYNIVFLDSLKTIFENEHIKHVRSEYPFIVKINGRKGFGLILKPE